MRLTSIGAVLLAMTSGCSQDEHAAQQQGPASQVERPVAVATTVDAEAVRAPSSVDAGAPGFVVVPVLDLAESRLEPGIAIYTSEGRFPAPAPEHALFRVAVGVPATDPAAEARRRLQASDLATGIHVASQRPIRIDGLAGFASEARGSFAGTPVRLYQVALFEPARSYVMQGRSSSERWNWYRAAFERMATSFRRR